MGRGKILLLGKEQLQVELVQTLLLVKVQLQAGQCLTVGMFQ